MDDMSEAVDACAGDAACSLLRVSIRARSHQRCMPAGRCTTMRCAAQCGPYGWSLLMGVEVSQNAVSHGPEYDPCCMRAGRCTTMRMRCAMWTTWWMRTRQSG